MWAAIITAFGSIVGGATNAHAANMTTSELAAARLQELQTGAGRRASQEAAIAGDAQGERWLVIGALAIAAIIIIALIVKK